MAEPDPNAGIALAFDDFGWGELSAEARARGCSESELVNLAISEYLNSISRRGWRLSSQVPDFGDAISQASRSRLIEVELTPEDIQGLRAEAARQQVSVPQLVIHAVMRRLAQD